MSRWSCAVLLVAAGCIVRTDEWTDAVGGGGGRSGIEDVSPYVEPSLLGAGQTALMSIVDYNSEADFRDVYDVRSLGDFQITEWTPTRDELQLVIEVDATAYGEQPLALDFDVGTLFTSFSAE